MKRAPLIVLASLALVAVVAGASRWLSSHRSDGPAPWLGVWQGPGNLDGSGSARWAFGDDLSLSVVDHARRLTVRGSWEGGDAGRRLRLDIAPPVDDDAGEAVSAAARRHAARAVAWTPGATTWQVEERDGKLILSDGQATLTLRRQ